MFSSIPTNLVCGFLGSGKTTVIRHLLQQKPPDEHWAVVVNEFGQVGIDASLLKSSGAVITDIPGGCMCCVSSQSFNVGLNRLIKSQQPDRILIEPTGLGHPTKLIRTLRGEYFSEVIDLKAVITLVDARQLDDERYLQHETFIDQLEVADVLVASKLDQYSEADRQRFYSFVERFKPAKQLHMMIEQGALPSRCLDLPADLTRVALHPDAHQHTTHQSAVCQPQTTQDMPPGWYQIDGEGNGFSSRGWRVDRNHVFNRNSLLKWLESTLHGLSLDRVKGVMNTSDGWLQINMTPGESLVQPSPKLADYSVLEIIGQLHFPDSLNAQLVNTLVKDKKDE